MEDNSNADSPNDEDKVDIGDSCPQKKTWPVIPMTLEEKKNMEEPVVRSWGPFG